MLIPAVATRVRRMLETAETIKGHRATVAAVGLVVVIGALLRFHDLGAESLWLDEAAS